MSEHRPPNPLTDRIDRELEPEDLDDDELVFQTQVELIENLLDDAANEPDPRWQRCLEAALVWLGGL